MEFYHLRSFVAVAQTGNLTRAAKRLYTTPPAISAHIKALEEELSTELFNRSSKGMELTEKGQLLLVKAQRTLESAVDLVNLAASNQHEIIGSFRLACNANVQQLRLAELVDNLRENCPGITLEVAAQSSGKILQALSKHQLEGGFVYGAVPQDMLAIKVKEQPITTVAPMSFGMGAAQEMQNVAIAQLSELPWIMMGEHCPFDQYLRGKFANELPFAVQSSDEATRLALVTQGLGVSFLELEEALKAAASEQVQILPALDFTMPLSFVVARERAGEPLIAAMLQEVRVAWDIKL